MLCNQGWRVISIPRIEGVFKSWCWGCVFGRGLILAGVRLSSPSRRRTGSCTSPLVSCGSHSPPAWMKCHPHFLPSTGQMRGSPWLLDSTEGSWLTRAVQRSDLMMGLQFWTHLGAAGLGIHSLQIGGWGCRLVSEPLAHRQYLQLWTRLNLSTFSDDVGGLHWPVSLGYQQKHSKVIHLFYFWFSFTKQLRTHKNQSGCLRGVET